MRTGRVLLAASVALALILALFLAPGTTPDVRFAAATAASATSVGGDAPARRRARAAADESPPADEASAPEDAEASDASVETSDEPEPPPPPCRVLRIVDEAGVPLPGVTVDGPRCGHRCSATDADGETRVDVVEPATRVAFVDGAETRTFELREARTQVVLKSPLKLEVSVVDAASGVALDPVRFELERGHGSMTTEWTAGPTPSLWRDERRDATFAVFVTPPAGFGGYRRIEWTGPIAERARVVRFVVPLFEAAERDFRVRLPDGRAAAGATVGEAHVGPGPILELSDESAVSFAASPSDERGLLRVSGLPRIPFTRVQLRISWTEERDGIETRLGASVVGLDLSAPSPDRPIDVILGVGGAYRGPSGWVSGCGRDVVTTGPTAALALRVCYRDGVPARSIRIVCDDDSTLTDADGRARFDALRVGRAPFVAYAHGFAPTRFEVDVGEVASCDVVEVESRPVRVVVRDGAGRPVPSALVLAKCGFIPWSKEGSRWIDCGLAQLDGDVEDVAPRTDRTGTVVLRLPKYEVQIDASLGDATASRSTSADEVEMTLREPDRTPPAPAPAEKEEDATPR